MTRCSESPLNGGTMMLTEFIVKHFITLFVLVESLAVYFFLV